MLEEQTKPIAEECSRCAGYDCACVLDEAELREEVFRLRALVIEQDRELDGLRRVRDLIGRLGQEARR